MCSQHRDESDALGREQDSTAVAMKDVYFEITIFFFFFFLLRSWCNFPFALELSFVSTHPVTLLLNQPFFHPFNI